MKTVIEMALEAGFVFGMTDPVVMVRYIPQDGFERFEDLVRADEREKYRWDVHSCGPTCKRYACVAMREAVEAEREACAKLCETLVMGKHCAAAIRARGNT
jgi:hypothetical protein